MPTPQQFDEAREAAGACIDFVSDACAWLHRDASVAVEDPTSVDIPEGAELCWDPAESRKQATDHVKRLDLAVAGAKRSVNAVVVYLRAVKPDTGGPVAVRGGRWVTAHEAVMAMTCQLHDALARELPAMQQSDRETARIVQRLGNAWSGLSWQLGDLVTLLDREHAVARTRAEDSQAQLDQAQADPGGGGEERPTERENLAHKVRETLERLQPPDDLPKWAERERILDIGHAMTDLAVHHDNDNDNDDDAENTMGNVDVLVAAVQNPLRGPIDWGELEEKHPKAFNRLAWLILLGVANLHKYRFRSDPEPRPGRCICPGGKDLWEPQTIAGWMDIAKTLLASKAGRGEVEGLLEELPQDGDYLSKPYIETSNSEDESSQQARPRGIAPVNHAPDFTSVNWFGTRYAFSKGNQAQAVRVLWEAWEQGEHGVSQETIGEKIGSAAERFEMRKTFRRKKPDGGFEQHPAWETMIQKDRKGCYCLARP